METKETEAIIQQSISKILRKERLTLCTALVPRVGKKEMQEIREQFSSPNDYNTDKFIIMTDWVRNGADLN